ncbi:hypothetical protein C7S18_04235 [Ahniella affigens]|uniref:Aminopeptidase n=1 Tax=Ahniella affigens TaxID=2021234 RepID=A0A2P1PNN4_9GAMM|nr:M1 family metallopeptidase [Ahniella affigens]AVP96450.1 hypothetical protein C7S18_04235 [Ahniella affigens]
MFLNRVAVLWLMLATTAFAEDAIPRGQLPKDVVPAAYDVSLRMDPRASSFSGSVDIAIDVKTSTKVFWMHARDSQLGALSFKQGERAIDAKATRVLDEAGLVRIDLAEPAAVGQARLSMAYTAPYNQRLEGAYQVKRDGESYVMTQMEPLGARNAFPCFDEPAFKTPWTIRIAAPKSDTVIANTSEVSTKNLADNWMEHQFATTKPLPTYLIAFAVGPWEIRKATAIAPSPRRPNAIPLRGIAAKGQSARMDYMLGETAKQVLALERYFDYGYPYDKLDLLAAPDFAYGAMENAGLITYREALMFASPNESTTLRRRALGTHVHELAHQWFGNLVTMPWWDDLWLNEAFASWIQGRILPELYPTLRADISRVEGGLWAMDSDSLASARRIHQPIDDYTDIGAAFDGITYQKGAAVLTMFEHYLTPEKFQKALRGHMRRFAFGNATSADLIHSFAAESTEPDRLKQAFASFTDQANVPLLKVTVQCSGKQPSIKVVQSRYRPIGASFTADALWQVPFCARLGGMDRRSRFCKLIDSAEATLPAPMTKCPSFVHPNADSAGYYRFQLDPKSEQTLFDNFRELPLSEQMALADSINAALNAGTSKTRDYLTRAPVFATGELANVVSAPLGSLVFLKHHVADPDQQAAIDRMLVKYWGDRLERMGFVHQAQDTDDTRVLRSTLVDALLRDGRPAKLVDAMARQGKQLLNTKKPGLVTTDIHPDFVAASLYAVVLKNQASAIAQINTQLSRNEDPIQRGAMLRALGAVNTDEALQMALDLTLDPVLKSSETGTVLYGLLENPALHDKVWAFLKTQHDAISNKIPAVWRGKISTFASGTQCSEAGAQAIEAFYGEKVKDLESGPRALAQAVEQVRQCAAKREALAKTW